jgi:hypothetical protein
MKVAVSGNIFSFPPECPCCGATPDTTLSVSASRPSRERQPRAETRVWDIPYCVRCISHMNAYEKLRPLARILTVLSIFLGMIVALTYGLYWGLGAGILSLAATLGIFAAWRKHVQSLRSPDCAGSGCAIAYIGWEASVHEFEIGSQRFAKVFLAANRKKLINLSPEAITLLAASSKGIGSGTARSSRRYLA